MRPATEHPNEPSVRSQTEPTIADFGEQWTRFDNKAGYLGSIEQLSEQLAPFLKPHDLAGLLIADVGAGTGRVSAQLAAVGAKKVVAIEPSDAFERLRLVAADHPGQIIALRIPADQIPLQDFDLVVCFGVLHHIPDAVSALRAFCQALRPGGRTLVWVYGAEGNGLYLAIVRPLRFVTKRLPPRVLDAVVSVLYPALRAYMAAAGVLPLPLQTYIRGVLSKLSREHIRLTIYDQLNPHHARYYRRSEILKEFSDAGFVDVEIAHKNGYSWLVSGRRGWDQGANVGLDASVKRTDGENARL